MDNFRLKTENGIEVELTGRDIYKVFTLYIEESVKEYLKENFEDWSDSMISRLADRAVSEIECDCGEGLEKLVETTISNIAANFWSFYLEAKEDIANGCEPRFTQEFFEEFKGKVLIQFVGWVDGEEDDEWVDDE